MEMEEKEGTSRELDAWGDFLSWDRIWEGKKAGLFASGNCWLLFPTPIFLPLLSFRKSCLEILS